MIQLCRGGARQDNMDHFTHSYATGGYTRNFSGWSARTRLHSVFLPESHQNESFMFGPENLKTRLFVDARSEVRIKRCVLPFM